MKKNIKYSVVIPAYNCSETIKPLCDEICAVFEKINDSFEILVVNDGGDELVWTILNEIYHAKSENFTIIRFAKNFGQHNAVLCGIEHAIGNFIITIDDDMQVHPKEILKLITEYQKKKSDLIYGIYEKKKHSFFRNILSFSLGKSSKFLLKAPGRGSSFRLITSALCKNLTEHKNNFVFIDELLLWYTDSISFTLTEHTSRKSGKSNYNSFKLISIVSNIVINYTAIPLKLMTYSGLIVSVITFLSGVYFIVKKIFFKVPIGYASIIVSILFSTSIIILSLGIIGQYLYKLYQIQNKKPSYSIKSIFSK